MNIRAALAGDVPKLDRIALEAKAHWGYSAEQLALWRRELLTPLESLRNCPAFVAEVDAEVVAFVQVDPRREPWELVALWVLPQIMRKGMGRALLRKVCDFSASFGQGVVAIDSDPNAEAFYLARGAKVTGQIPAPIQGNANRTRPQLLLSTKEIRG